MTKATRAVCLSCIILGIVLIASIAYASSQDVLVTLPMKWLITVVIFLQALVLFLFGSVVWWTRRYISRNDTKWAENWVQHRDYDGWGGEHKASMRLQGCAFDSVAHQRMIDNSVVAAIKKVILSLRTGFENDREIDKPPYTNKGEVPKGVGGD